MKKYLLLLLLFTASQIFAQVLPLPTMEESSLKSKSSKITFDELSKSGESYFKNIDVDKKGSGYKPFKRWEYHWKHYLQPDGTIAPAQHLWQAWEQKQKMSISSKAVSNWTDKGPFDQSSKSGQGRINTVLVDPNDANTIYVGAPAGGLWRSTDAGVNWTPLSDDLPQIGVSGIAIHPSDSNTIYITTGDDDAGDSYSIGVLKSTDGGTTWNTTGGLGLGSGIPISNEIVIDPSNSSRVWVATGAGMYLSTDGGDSWDLKESGNFRDFKLKPGDPNTIYAVTGDTFFRSTDGGSSFLSTSTGLPSSDLARMRVEVTAAAANNVYVLGAGTNPSYSFQGVFTSDDSGATFTQTLETNDIFNSTQAWYDLAFVVSDTDANKMFVGVLDIWSSNDKGDSFTQLNEWFTLNSTFTHADIHFMRYYDGILYAGTDGGVFKSTNDGATFTDLTKNLSISQFYKISVSKQSSNKMAGGLQDNGGFSLSNNTWNNYHGGDGMDAASDPNDENTFYGFTQFGGFLTTTNDGGVSSTTIAASPISGNWVTPLVVNKASEIYAGYNSLYRLENSSWIKISPSFGANLEVIEIDPSNNDIIFVSTGTTISKSINRGETFTSLLSSVTGISGTNISSIEVHNSDSNIVWVTTSGSGSSQFPSSGLTGGGVYKSIDGGLTFTNITRGLPGEARFVVRHHPFTTNNSIYVGTALGVYHRNDDDNTWEVFSTNLPNVAISDIEINPYDNTITAATYGRSVWQSAIPAITLPAIEADLVKVKAADNLDIVSCGNSITPSITVVNNGQNTLTSITVNYNVDGGANEILNWTGNIPSAGSSEIVLNPISVLTDGEHTLNAEIVVLNDTNSFNNSSSSNFTFKSNIQGVAQTTYTFGDPNPSASEDPINWSVSDDNLWQIGSPTTTILNGLATSGYVTNASGNYPDQTISLLTSPCYNLSILENPALKFSMAFDLEENWDIVYVEFSIDEGTTWDILGTSNDPNWYNSNRTNASSGANDDCQNCPGAQWTGTDGTLKEYSYNLSPFNNETSVIFRFKFVSDQSVTNEGVLIDNFIIDASAVLSVNDFEEGEFLIYPNPSSDVFNIRRMSTIGENMNIKVYDIIGKLIKQRNNIIDANYELDMTGVSKGIYFLHVSIDNKRLVKKLVLN